MFNENILSLNGSVFSVGTSALIGFTVLPGENRLVIKAVSAGTSGLYIGGSSMAVGLGAGLSGILSGGYLLSTSDVLNLQINGTIFFTSAGSTSVVSILVGKSFTEGAGLV